MEHKLLQNFIHLVTAVDVATRRSVTREKVELYSEQMYLYLAGIKELFNHDLVGNHHLSLHLPPFLEDFGPVHGWWAFAFERYNGVLGRLNKNNHTSTCLSHFFIILR